MSSKWSWISFFATACALVLGVIFFVATQEPSRRDFAVLAIGATIGITAAACFATFIFHAHPRTDRKNTTDRDSSKRTTPAPNRGTSIAVPGMKKHGNLTAHWNMQTDSHLIKWTSNHRVMGRLDPADEGGGWVVLYGNHLQQQKYSSPDGERLGTADSLEQGMEMLEARASKTS